MNKFEILRSKSLYQGRIFSLESVEARLPDGKTRDFDLVRHPGAVTILPLDEQGRIWFVHQYRLGADRVLLELPAGLTAPGEEPAACAAREVREEIGMAARKIERMGGFFLAPGYSSEYLHIFIARDLYPDRLPADDDEFIHTEAIPAQQAYAMAKAGKIEDGKTLATLLLAETHLAYWIFHRRKD